MSARDRGDSDAVHTDISAKDRAKRRHDLTGALRTLKFTLDGLRKGYRYDDANALAKIDALAKAVAVIERESTAMMDVLARE